MDIDKIDAIIIMEADGAKEIVVRDMDKIGKIMAQFVNAQTKFFDSSDYDGAVAWIAA